MDYKPGDWICFIETVVGESYVPAHFPVQITKINEHHVWVKLSYSSNSEEEIRFRNISSRMYPATEAGEILYGN